MIFQILYKTRLKIFLLFLFARGHDDVHAPFASLIYLFSSSTTVPTRIKGTKKKYLFLFFRNNFFLLLFLKRSIKSFVLVNSINRFGKLNRPRKFFALRIFFKCDKQKKVRNKVGKGYSGRNADYSATRLFHQNSTNDFLGLTSFFFPSFFSFSNPDLYHVTLSFVLIINHLVSFHSHPFD